MMIPKDPGTNQRQEIRIASSKLVFNQVGQLVEDLDLLAHLRLFLASLSRTFSEVMTVKDILGEEGFYVIPLFFDSPQTDMALGDISLPMLAWTFKNCSDKLEENAERSRPMTAAELGLRDAVVNASECLAKVEINSTGVSLRDCGDRSEIPLCAPPLEVFKALPKRLEPPKPVDGEVTLAGLSDGTGTRIEVNKSTVYFVPGLSSEQAYEVLQSRARVTGCAQARDHQWVLETYEFYQQLGLVPAI